MSWTDIFPVLSDEMLADYKSGVTQEDELQLEEWLGVAEIFRPRRKLPARAPQERQQVVSATLFWKMVLNSDPELPTPTRARLVMARRLGLVKRFDPWSSYVEPLLDHSAAAMARNPAVRFRLYLARDLEFLVDDFTALGWEVYLMRSPSIRYCPGGFWRFLALGEKRAVVTVIDSDRMNVVDGEIARTKMMDQMGLGLWRVPGYHSADNDGHAKEVLYRPILGGHFGGRGGLPVKDWIKAFIWHAQRASLPVIAHIPGRGDVPIQRVSWPNYGFDEWFQLAALYPRMVPRGTLTFVPSGESSMLLPVDIEYVTWANRRSEMVYF